jgi:hypothetical protein
LMGGDYRRPSTGRKNSFKFDYCVFIQLRSNSLYQKSLKKSNRSAPPLCRQAALPRRKIAFPLRKNARAKTKNVKAIFLFGSVLTNKAAGFRLRLAGKNFPPQLPQFLPARQNSKWA